jgi:hypothetical protein
MDRKDKNSYHIINNIIHNYNNNYNRSIKRNSGDINSLSEQIVWETLCDKVYNIVLENLRICDTIKET